MKNTGLLTIIAFVLLILILITVFADCKCVQEGFAVAKKIDVAPSGEPTSGETEAATAPTVATPDNIESYENSSKEVLTDTETQLLNSIRNKDLNDESINSLIDKGVITEKLIEKFLAYVDSMPDPATPVTVKDFIDEKTEHFIGKYAPAPGAVAGY